MKPEINYKVYLVTDRKFMSTETLEEAVEQAIQGGVTLVQLREKECSSKEYYETALSIKKITDKYNVPLLIDDRIDIALAADAAGVHIGQSDIPCSIARKILGEDKIIGVTAKTIEQAVKAEKDGADYLGVGAVFKTGTKKDAINITMEDLKNIRKSVKIPITAIGGINKDRIKEFKGTGINGTAIVSGIIAQKDIKKAAMEVKEELDKIIE